MLRDVANALLCALIAPPCVSCGRVIDQPLDGAVCATCWAAIHARVSTFAVASIRHVRAVGPYEGVLRDVLHALKYDGRRSCGQRLSRLMAENGSDILEGADCVVPVPLHPRRQRERGFNQASDLARGLGLPVVHALRRVSATPPQVGLSSEKRRENVRDAFALPPAPRVRAGRSNHLRARLRWSAVASAKAEDRPLQGCTVVLIDDVVTTGATLEACARTLRRAGCQEVRALTAAQVASGPRRTPLP